MDDPLSASLRRDLDELASRLGQPSDSGGPHLAARLRAVLEHAGPDLHLVIRAQVHDADAAAVEAQVAALRAGASAWAASRAPYARGLAGELGTRADRAHRDWLTLKRLLDARWGSGAPSDAG
ncbi:MAG TPA: hypothetical protein VEA99_09440 [Gemmatimonadaceae bacterium]|nr:hypothetical protein [Gemmatimonadaceae bacterium]